MYKNLALKVMWNRPFSEGSSHYGSKVATCLSFYKKYSLIFYQSLILFISILSIKLCISSATLKPRFYICWFVYLSENLDFHLPQFPAGFKIIASKEAQYESSHIFDKLPVWLHCQKYISNGHFYFNKALFMKQNAIILRWNNIHQKSCYAPD